MEPGGILAPLHSVAPDSEHGTRHELRLPKDASSPGSCASSKRHPAGPAAATVVERSADFLRQKLTSPRPPFSLARRFLPKNLAIHEGTAITLVDQSSFLRAARKTFPAR